MKKKDKDKRFFKIWKPISLLSVDIKLVSKGLAECLKNVLPSLISPNQTAYVNGRFINKGRGLMTDLWKISDSLKTKVLLLRVNIEKIFDIVNYNSLSKVLWYQLRLWSSIKWISILFHNQESCVINGYRTAQYFSLKIGIRQGDPISTYLFFLVLEIAFIFI